MEINSIILRGEAASGKTFIAETMATFFQSNKVLRFDLPVVTRNYVFRKTLDYYPELLIFDECSDLKEIESMNNYLLKKVLPFLPRLKNVIYLTQNTKEEFPKFRVIECTYQNNN